MAPLAFSSNVNQTHSERVPSAGVTLSKPALQKLFGEALTSPNFFFFFCLLLAITGEHVLAIRRNGTLSVQLQVSSSLLFKASDLLSPVSVRVLES